MQFKIGRVELLNALNKVEKATGKGKLIGIKIEVSDVLTLSATNNEITIETVVEELDINKTGVALVNGKLLSELARKVDAKIIHFEIIDNKLNIKAGRSKFDMNLLDLDSFPITNIKKTWLMSVELESKKLDLLIRKTIIATSNSNTRPQLMGVNFKAKEQDNKLYAFATDSYRVAKDYIEVNQNIDLDIIIPATSLNELTKIIDTETVNVSFNNAYASFSFGNTEFETRLISGAYPDLEKLIDIDFKGTYTINRQALISALERANIVLDTNSKQIVKVDYRQNLVEISTTENEIGQAYEEIETKSSGVELQNALSVKYFLDALKSFDSNEVIISLKGELTPFTITSNEENLLQLILPVRV